MIIADIMESWIEVLAMMANVQVQMPTTTARLKWKRIELKRKADGG